MDFSPVIQVALEKLWFITPLLVLAAILKSSWFKGWVGEAMVNLSALVFLDRKTYHLIRNVTLPTEDGTTQIDHIIVSPYGVFVVEAREIKGEIYGSVEQQHRLQRVGRYVNRFENALRQNRDHVNTLQALLGLREGQVHSMGVFLGRAVRGALAEWKYERLGRGLLRGKLGFEPWLAAG